MSGPRFGRYRTAAGARIAELSFAIVFAQAENDILAGRLSAVHGEASKEKARADELDRDNKEKDRRLSYSNVKKSLQKVLVQCQFHALILETNSLLL